LARALTLRQTEAGGGGYVQGVRLLAALGLLLLTASVAAGCGGSQKAAAEPPPSFAGSALTPPKATPDFSLRDAHGRTISMSEQRGKLVLVTFIYTHCPDICPLITQNLNDALQQLGTKRKDVSVLAVSVDPRGDTAKAVRAYEKLHHLVPEFHYLIGSKPELLQVWKAWGVAAVASDPELVDHTAYTMLVDRAGKGRVIYDAHIQSKQVVHDVRALLAA
jgi:protein SCO1/2